MGSELFVVLVEVDISLSPFSFILQSFAIQLRGYPVPFLPSFHLNLFTFLPPPLISMTTKESIQTYLLCSAALLQGI